MTIQAEYVSYGDQTGYLAFPERAAAPLPAVLVIQEVWGVDAHIEDVTRRVAASGYVALAPDIYAQGGARPAPLTKERIGETQGFMNKMAPAAWMDQKTRDAELAKLPQAEGIRIGETFGVLFSGLTPGSPRYEQYIKSLIAGARFLRSDCQASRGKGVAAVGFCMGGGLSALLACRDPELRGAVIFYGNSPALAEVPAIRCPILGLYGALDQRVNAGINPFAEAMQSAGKKFAFHIYDGAQHGFFNDGRPAYDAFASRDAWVRTLEFLGESIGGAQRHS